MSKELLRYKPNQKYLVFDTETEGLNLIMSRPWQCAWTIIEIKGDSKIQVIKEQDRIIEWDGLKIPDVVKKLTGFSWARYNKEKECPKKVWADFKKDLLNEDCIIAGQNILGFDIYMLSLWAKKVGDESFNFDFMKRILDTRALGIAMNQESPYHADLSEEERLYWQIRLISLQKYNRKIKASQSHLLKTLDIDFEEKKLHDAKYDNFKCGEILAKMIWQFEI